MKKNNPTTPIMLREETGTLPKIFARYGETLRGDTSAPLHAAELRMAGGDDERADQAVCPR